MYSKRKGTMAAVRAQQRARCHNQQFLSSLTKTKDNQQQHRSFPLPPELLFEILSYVSNCQATLHAASLVCKQWLYCTAPILYCHPQINDTYRWAIFILTLTRERMSFFYGDLIRSIDLSSGKSIEAMKDQEFYRRLSDTNESQSQTQPATGEQLIYPNFTSNRSTYPNLTVGTISNFAHPPINREQQEQEHLGKGLPFIIVSTSSLIQLSLTCKNITTLNLSYTSLLYDSQVAETGEYLSTLQRYSAQPGLTHIQIPIEDAIEAIGTQCSQLQEVKIQRCEWVTAHVIWMFVYHCSSLKRLDARRSTKCTVKRLISSPLEVSNGNLSLNESYPTTTVSETAVREYQHLLSQRRLQQQRDEMNFQDQFNSNNEFIHFGLNEESGLFEPVEIIDDGRNDLDLQLAEEEAIAMHQLNTHWLAPPSAESAIGRRPPSPTHQQIAASGNNDASTTKSLQDMVHDIIMDAKDLGAADLNWLQDYY